MGIREITGYIAHFLLAVYWLYVITRTAPQLRRNARDKKLRLQILLIKSGAILLTTLLVGVIHFWATQWWHVIVAVLVSAVLGRLLNRAYRRIVSVPRHRRSLTQRGGTFKRGYREMQRPLPLPGHPADGRPPTAVNGHEVRRRLSGPVHRHAR